MRTALYKKRIIFAPSSAKRIAIYDIEQSRWVMLELENKDIEGKFHDIVVYDHYVFLIGHRYPAIIKIDMEDYTIQYLNDWVEELKTLSGENIPGFVFANKVNDNKILIPQFLSNIVMELDLKTNLYRLIKIAALKGNIAGLAKTECNTYLLSINVLCEVDGQGIALKIIDLNTVLEKLFYYAVLDNNCLYIFPIRSARKNTAVMLDLQTEKSKSVFLQKQGDHYGNFSCIREIGNKIYLFSRKSNSLIIYDLCKNSCREIQICFKEDFKTYCIEDENGYMDLPIFLEDLKNTYKNQCILEKDNYGGRIWGICKTEF